MLNKISRHKCLTQIRQKRCSRKICECELLDFCVNFCLNKSLAYDSFGNRNDKDNDKNNLYKKFKI